MTRAPGPDGRFDVRFAATGHFRLHVPPGPSEEPAPLLVAFHGYAQPPEEMFDWARSVAPAGWAVLAPEGPSSFYRRPFSSAGAAAGGVGYGWVADPRRAEQDARNDALVDACLEGAREVRAFDPSRVVLLGYSQGVGVLMHWWSGRPEGASAAVGVAGGVTASSRPLLRRLAGRDVLWVTGERDVAYPPAYASGLLEALHDAAVAVHAVRLDETHALLEPARETVRAWLASR